MRHSANLKPNAAPPFRCRGQLALLLERAKEPPRARHTLACALARAAAAPKSTASNDADPELMLESGRGAAAAHQIFDRERQRRTGQPEVRAPNPHVKPRGGVSREGGTATDRD